MHFPVKKIVIICSGALLILEKVIRNHTVDTIKITSFFLVVHERAIILNINQTKFSFFLRAIRQIFYAYLD